MNQTVAWLPSQIPNKDFSRFISIFGCCSNRPYIPAVRRFSSLKSGSGEHHTQSALPNARIAHEDDFGIHVTDGVLWFSLSKYACCIYVIEPDFIGCLAQNPKDRLRRMKRDCASRP